MDVHPNIKESNKEIILSISQSLNWKPKQNKYF